MISILSTCEKIFSGFCSGSITTSSVLCNKFSGLGIFSISNSPVFCIIFSGLWICSISNSTVLCNKFSGLLISYIINSLINCVCKGSLSKAIISILSTWDKIFSGLCSGSISNSPVFWTKFSGLSNAYMINLFINCFCKGSFSKPIISRLSLDSNIFSGLVNCSNSNSPVFCTKISGLGIASIIKAFINCLCKGSLSKAMNSILSTWEKIFSGLWICVISTWVTCWYIFSGLGIAKIINWFIACFTRGSFSYPIISRLSLDSKIFSGFVSASIINCSIFFISFTSLIISSIKSSLMLCTINFSFSAPNIWILSLELIFKSGFGVFSMTNSIVFWHIFSSFWIPSIFNWFIFCLNNSSFSYPIIVILSLCSIKFSSFSSLSIDTSSALWISFSAFSKPSTIKALINCLCKGSFSKDITWILSLDSIIFSSFSFFWMNISLFSFDKFSQGIFTPCIYKQLIFWILFSSFSKDAIFNALFSWIIFSSFGSLSIRNFSRSLSGFISSNHFSKIGVPLICNKFIFCCNRESFSAASIHKALLPSSMISSSQFLLMFNIERSSCDISLTSFQSFLSHIYKLFIGQNWTVLIQGWLSEYIPKP